MPNDLARRASSDDVHVDLLGSWSDLDQTWPEVKFSNWPFKVKKYMFQTGSTRQTRCVIFIFVSVVSKSYQWKTISVKTINFHSMTSGGKIIDLRSILMKINTGAWRELPNVFLRILPSYHPFGDNSDCLREIAIFSKFDLWRPLVTSKLVWPENDLYKSSRSRRDLSYAVYRLLLSIA